MHHLDDAIAEFRQGWTLASSDHERALSACNLGVTLHLKGGRDQEALEWLEKARDLLASEASSGFYQANVDSAIAEIKRDSGDYKTAEVYLREALGASTKDVKELVSLQNVLADLLREEGNDEEARALFTSMLAHPDLKPQLRLDALMGIADIDRSRGEYGMSIRKWNDAIQQAQNDRDQISEGIALRGLGVTWFERGDLSRAEPLLRRSLSLMESSSSAPGEQIATGLIIIGKLHRAQNKLSIAVEELLKAMRAQQKLLGDRHPQVAYPMEELACAYADQGDEEEARKYSRKAAELIQDAFGDDSLPMAGALAAEGYVEARAEQMDSAAQKYAAALKITRRYPDQQRLTLGLTEHYRLVLKALHRDHEAAGLTPEGQGSSPESEHSPF